MRRQDKDALESLRPTIDRWKELIFDFSNKDSEDAAYWYSERADCGIFSTAAYYAGGRSLVAYGDDKVVENESYRGRVDLWIETDDKETFVIEAKHKWLWKFRSVRDLVSQLEKRLARACEDAATVAATEKDHRLGFLFAVPGPIEGDRQRAMDLFDEARREVEGVNINEWVELRDAPPWKDRVYPGVLLLGRLVP